MQDLAFWKAVIVDESNALETIVELLERNHVRYCVIGGQALNAYVDPLVSLDLDLVVAAEQIQPLEELLRKCAAGSKLRVQIQTDPRHAPFLERARPRQVLGLRMPVASLEDILQGKIWAAQDPQRRPSKRRKDLLDIERILEAYPELRAQAPPEILDRLQKG
jgi:Nucleotidyl transferase AbiEii toxin, Type IV TA system